MALISQVGLELGLWNSLNGPVARQNQMRNTPDCVPGLFLKPPHTNLLGEFLSDSWRMAAHIHRA